MSLAIYRIIKTMHSQHIGSGVLGIDTDGVNWMLTGISRGNLVIFFETCEISNY